MIQEGILKRRALGKVGIEWGRVGYGRKNWIGGFGWESKEGGGEKNGVGIRGDLERRGKGGGGESSKLGGASLDFWGI